MKKQYNFKNAQRGRFARKAPTLEGRGVQHMHPRVVNVSFDVTQEVASALRVLRDTGLFGNGVDCASVAEELLRRALLDPAVLPYWRNREAPPAHAHQRPSSPQVQPVPARPGAEDLRRTALAARQRCRESREVPAPLRAPPGRPRQEGKLTRR